MGNHQQAKRRIARRAERQQTAGRRADLRSHIVALATERKGNVESADQRMADCTATEHEARFALSGSRLNDTNSADASIDVRLLSDREIAVLAFAGATPQAVRDAKTAWRKANPQGTLDRQFVMSAGCKVAATPTMGHVVVSGNGEDRRAIIEGRIGHYLANNVKPGRLGTESPRQNAETMIPADDAIAHAEAMRMAGFVLCPDGCWRSADNGNRETFALRPNQYHASIKGKRR